MTWLAPLISALAVLLVAGARYRLVGLRHAAPVPLSPPVWAGTICLLGVVAITLLGCLARSPERARIRGPLLELALGLAGLFSLVWGVLPSDGLRLWHWVVVASVTAAVLVLYRNRPPSSQRQGTFGVHFRRGLRRLTVPTAAVVLACAGIAAVARVPIRPGAILLSLATYPLFALAQLTLFVGVVLPRLSRIGRRRGEVLAVCASIFALAHWPNAFLMVACFAAMLLWGDTYLRTPSLSALALSMGLAGTAAAQLLPNGLTHHLRTGPGYVLYAHRVELWDLERDELARWTSPGFYREAGSTVGGYVTALYQEVLHRNPSPAELRGWITDVEQRHREAVVRNFLGSAEHRARSGRGSAEANSVAAKLASTEWFAQNGGNWPAYVQALYVELLGRPASAAEVAAWSPDPDLTERTRTVRAFLDSDELASHPGTPAFAVHHLGPLLGR